MAGFDHGRQRGTVHVADHNVSVGKKFFTWGSRSSVMYGTVTLTDEDGAYLEIMTGCYTDNQPDFSFIAPDETKTFEQTWYATAHMPGLKNAEKDGAVGFVLNGRRLEAAFQVTAVHKQARICVEVKGGGFWRNAFSWNRDSRACGAWKRRRGRRKRIYRCFFLMNRENPGFLYLRAVLFQGREKPAPHRPAKGSRRRYPRRRSCIWRASFWSSTGM